MALIGALVVAGAVALATVAPPTRSAGGATHPLPTVEDVREAQRRFRRGVDLYKDGDVSGAMAELARAYQLAPTFQILYDLGQMSCERSDYAAGLQYFRRYLDDGGTAIAASRREEVSQEIERLHERVGRIDISTPDDRSEVLLDDLSVGSSPLQVPLLTNVGRHRIEVVSPSGERQRRVVDVAGGQIVSVIFPASVEGTVKAGGEANTVRIAPKPKVNEPIHLNVAHEEPGVDRAETDEAAPRPPWAVWSVGAVLAAGAVVTGAMAARTSSELHGKLDSFPIRASDVAGLESREHRLALAADACAVAAAIATSIALYLTFSHGPRDDDDDGAVERRRAMVEF